MSIDDYQEDEYEYDEYEYDEYEYDDEEEKLQKLRQAYLDCPQDAKAAKDLSSALVSYERYDEVVRVCENVLAEIDMDAVDPLWKSIIHGNYALGLIHTDSSDLDLVMANAQLGLQCAYDDDEYYSTFVWWLFENGYLEEVREFLECRLLEEPENCEHLDNMGNYWGLKGDAEQALYYFRLACDGVREILEDSCGIAYFEDKIERVEEAFRCGEFSALWFEDYLEESALVIYNLEEDDGLDEDDEPDEDWGLDFGVWGNGPSGRD